MGAREELAAIRERRTHLHMCTPECGGCDQVFEPVVDPDIDQLATALDAVVEIREWIRRAQFMRVEVPMFDIAQRLDGALAALTTDTKGEPR